MTEQDLLRALALLDAAFITWEASGQDEADLLALREQLQGKSVADKLAVLQVRSNALQDRIDTLRNA